MEEARAGKWYRDPARLNYGRSSSLKKRIDSFI